MSTPLDPDAVEPTATGVVPVQLTTTTTSEDPTATGDSTSTAGAGSVTTVTVTAPAETSANTDTDASSAATTTLSILAIPFPTGQNILQDLVGSISAVDHENEETTIVLDCAPTVTSCLKSLIPLTITTGPSTFIYTWSWDGPGWDTIPSTVTVDSTETIKCGIVGTQTIGCMTTHVDTISGSAMPETTALSVYGTEGFTYEAVPITGGVEKLETATSATATSTGDSAGESTESGASDTDGDSGSSSKAWIAGPVIGGLVAIALVVGLIFFLRRRRQKRAAAADTTTPIAELPEKGVYKGELPAREPAAAELSAVKGQNQIHELA
ncbi:hypothetical protein BJY00DRAFT_295365 [Aspergillus carlsbadensis]|nr:hypothetical protein BJY00DRAFT_295365 [Aspergillus carlsbadensis]